MDAEAPPAEVRDYRAHLGTCDAIAAAPLVGTVTFVGATGGAALLGEAYFGAGGDQLGPLAIGGLRALPWAALATGAGFVTCGPLVHGLHGRPGAAAASFGVRAGFPALAFVLTYAMVQASTPHDGQDHVAPGWQGGAAGAIAISGAIAAALFIDYRYLAVTF